MSRKLKYIYALTPALLATALICSTGLSSENGDDENDFVIPISSSDTPTDKIPLKLYKKTLSTALSSVHDSMIVSLNNREEIEKPKSHMDLQDVAVGLGLSFTVGLSRIWSTTITPHLRVVFSCNTTPTYPD